MVAVDILLASLTKRLRELRPTPSAEVAVVDEKGEVLAASDFTDEELADRLADADQTFVGNHHAPVIAKAVAAAKRTSATHLFPIEANEVTQRQEALVSRLEMLGSPLYLVVAAPHRNCWPMRSTCATVDCSGSLL